jgi:hypothetical protein
MLRAPGRSLSIQFDDRKFRQYGREAMHPKLGRFLNDEIHPITAGNSLDQSQRQTGFDVSHDRLAGA